MNYSDAPKIIYKFLIYNETIRGKSRSTVLEYYQDLKTFFKFIKHYKNIVDKKIPINEINISDIDIDLIKEITLNDAYEFLLYCKNERNNNEKTRARKVSTLKSFFKYLYSNALINYNPLEELETPKLRKTLPKYLDLETSISLLEAVDGPNKERNYAIITIFLNCGLRLAELCAMNINDLNFRNNSFKVKGKGNKERIVYMNNACINALKKYLEIRLNSTSQEKEALFISRNDKRISRRMVQQIVEDLLKKIGLTGQGYSTHKLRHTAATLMYQHGNVDIRVLQEILGHENLGTTEIYTHLSNKQMKNATDSNPLSKIKN